MSEVVTRRSLFKLLGATLGAAAIPVAVLGGEEIFLRASDAWPPMSAESGWLTRNGLTIEWGRVSTTGVSTFPVAFAELLSVQVAEGMITEMHRDSFTATVAGACWLAIGT